MWQDMYVREKLRELEEERMVRPSPAATAAPGRGPLFGPVIRAAGRRLRRVGEGLEAWASPPPEREPRSRWRFDEPA